MNWQSVVFPGWDQMQQLWTVAIKIIYELHSNARFDCTRCIHEKCITACIRKFINNIMLFMSIFFFVPSFILIFSPRKHNEFIFIKDYEFKYIYVVSKHSKINRKNSRHFLDIKIKILNKISWSLKISFLEVFRRVKSLNTHTHAHTPWHIDRHTYILYIHILCIHIYI